MKPRVAMDSQPEKLRGRMGEAQMSHGQEVRATVPNVRVSRVRSSIVRKVPTVYFCGMGPIRVHETLEQGDGGQLPTEVELDGLDFPEEGLFTIRNAVVSSNGRLRISADEQTAIEKVEV